MIHAEVNEGESLNDGNETISTDSGSDSGWMLDDATPGSGERPDWLPEKFKSAADLGKSYRELEKMKATASAPDKYDVSNAKFLDTSTEAFENLQKVARDNRMPQGVMDEFVTSMDSYLGQFQEDSAAEMSKLGPESQHRIEVLESWVENNLEPDDATALFGEIHSAEGFKALETLRNKMMDNQNNVPSGNDTATSNEGTLDDLQSELSENLERYKTDTKYQKEMQGKMARFAQNSNYVDKQGS